MTTLRTLRDGTRLRFHHEGDDALAVYDNLPASDTRPGHVMVYALVGEHSEAPQAYNPGRPYTYGSDPRLDGQVDRITSILESRTPA